MHKNEELLMNKIIEKNDKKDMEQIGEFYRKMMCYIPEDMKTWILEEMYEMAYGMVITEEIAKEWIYSMKPIGQKWTIEETTAAMKSLGYNCDPIEFWVTSNMIYNDNYNSIKTGKMSDELVLENSYNWLNDTDAKDHKLYRYYKNIIKK